jgi:hypothetical protein
MPYLKRAGERIFQSKRLCGLRQHQLPSPSIDKTKEQEEQREGVTGRQDQRR